MDCQHGDLPEPGYDCLPDLSDDTFGAQVKKRSVRLGWRQALQLGQAVPGSPLPCLCVGYDIVQVEDHPKSLIRAHVMPHAFCSSDLQRTSHFHLQSESRHVHAQGCHAGWEKFKIISLPRSHVKQGSAVCKLPSAARFQEMHGGGQDTSALACMMLKLDSMQAYIALD